MSDIRDILQRVSELVRTLNELVEHDATQLVARMATELGIAELIIGAAELLSSALGALVDELMLFEQVMLQVNGINALLGMLTPLVEALGAVTVELTGQAEAYGIGDATSLQPIEHGMNFLDESVAVMSQLADVPGRFDQMSEELARLRVALDTLVAQSSMEEAA